MSQFDRYTTSEYVDTLREFMGFSKRTFMRDHGFAKDTDQPRTGRLPRYDEAPILALEDKVNARIAEMEAADTFHDRYVAARSYMGVKDNDVAKHTGVTRELVRRWGLGIQNCTRKAEIAAFLDVPLDWLDCRGGEELLPADSRIGCRVGAVAREYREQLYGLTQSLIAQLPEDADEQYAQAFIEWKIFNEPELSKIARRCGGRWQVLNGLLMFSPWIPIQEHDLARRAWSDEVEQMIQEELKSKPTVYGAWLSLRDRCLQKGIPEDQFPKKITLHKRVEKDRLRVEKFGVNLNDMVAASVARYIQ